MQTWTHADWERLGAAIEQRRLAVGYRSRAKLASDAGIDPSTLSELEKARRTNFSEATLDAVFRALRWPPWTWRDILDGRDPADIVENLSSVVAVDDTGRRDVGERRLVSAVQILETVYEDMLAGQGEAAAGLVLAAIHMIGAGADMLGLDNEDLNRARNRVSHSYQTPGIKVFGAGSAGRADVVRPLMDVDVSVAHNAPRRSTTVAQRVMGRRVAQADQMAGDVQALLEGPLRDTSLNAEELRRVVVLSRAYDAAMLAKQTQDSGVLLELLVELVGDAFVGVGRALRGRPVGPAGSGGFDPSIHEPVAADTTAEPTSAELREQHEAAEEDAAAAEERRRQDENDEGA